MVYFCILEERVNLSSPLVSVVIPLFNKEQWISCTLSSVYAQTYVNWECLIINDGSTDRSLESVNRFIQSHPGNWKVINQVNSGQTKSRNLGIEKASGEFIAFLDADDLWLPEKLEMQVKLHLSDPDIGLSLTSYAIFHKNQVRGFRVVNYSNPYMMIDRWFRLTGFGGLVESTGFIRRETLETFGRYSETFSMTSGLDLCLKIASTLKIEVLPKPLVLYRLSPGQFHKQEDVLIRDLEIMTLKHTNNIKERKQLRQFHLNYFFWSNCRGRGPQFFVISVIKSLLFFRWASLPMLYFLLSRNLLALARGFIKRKLIRRSLDSLIER